MSFFSKLAVSDSQPLEDSGDIKPLLVPSEGVSGVLSASETPSGTKLTFQSEPKRLYTVNGKEVPSVTQILDCLNKPALPFWGGKIHTEGVLELVKRGKLIWLND